MAKTIRKPRVKKVIETTGVSSIEVSFPGTTVESSKTEVAVEESVAKKQFRAYMADYKAKNPVKYALKEAELLKQLNQL